jgi:uncharacterized metal-binding protein YceD (DUF177 family)
MKELKDYIIPFVGLSIGSHRFDYQLKDEFFEFFEYEEFNSADIHVVLDFNKRSNHFDLNFSFEGKVNVNCDVTDEEFDMNVKGDLRLLVNEGEEFNDDNPELLIIPHGEYELNVAQYIYEMIVLSLPLKRVHPGIEDGTLDSDVYNKLEELRPQGSIEEKEEEKADPRWDKLKDLLTGK